MSLNRLISGGGKVLVVGGREQDWREFVDHPALLFWAGEQKDIKRQVATGFPDNIKGVVLSRFLSHSEGGTVIEEARKRRALIIPTRNDGEIKRVLREITTKEQELLAAGTPPPPPVPLLPPPPMTPEQQTFLRSWERGEQIRFLAQHHRAEGSISEEARRLHALATEQGIATTVSSMTSAVFRVRKDLGIRVKEFKGGPKKKATVPEDVPAVRAPAVKRTGPTTPDMDILLGMIEDAMAGLSLIREKVEKIRTREQKEAGLRARLERLLQEAEDLG